MKTVKRICLCVALLLFLCGCRAPEATLPGDFLLLPGYAAQEGELLGQNRRQMWGSLYTLEGLPPEQFLYLKSDADGDHYLCMQQNANAPILQCEVKKIEIRQPTGQSVVLTEEPIINRLLAAVRTKTGEKIEQPSILNLNTTVYFDLPCKLTWSCSIEDDGAGGIHLLYCDAKTGDWYAHEVAHILSESE